MPLPMDHSKLWPPEKHSADERWESDRRAGVEGIRPPYLQTGTYFVYFSSSDVGPSGGIYNLSQEHADLVIERLLEDREVSFEELLVGMLGAGFGYQYEDIRYIK